MPRTIFWFNIVSVAINNVKNRLCQSSSTMAQKMLMKLLLIKSYFIHCFKFFFFYSVIDFTRQLKICHVAEKCEFLTFRQVNFHLLDAHIEEIGVKRLRQR